MYTFLKQSYLAVVASLFLIAGMCHSQATSATVTGEIKDSTGAVVAGTSVSLTNLATGIITRTVTSNQGMYRISGLIPGVYRENVTAQGFKSVVKDGIELHVEDQIELNFTLEVGSVSENVTVQAGEPLIDVQSTTLGETVQGRQVQEAPLNGRNAMNLVALVPGVVAQGSSMGSTLMNMNVFVMGINVPDPNGWGNYQINGGMAGWNATFVDGANVNASYQNGQTLVPTQDSIGEFRVDTSAISPQYGRFGGGVINFSTKSGANKFHGTAYEYDRNTVFNAHTFFEDRFNEPKSVLHQNQFGATLGGPILRDKAFFFFSWDSTRIVTASPTDYRVPTAAEMGGDFTADYGTTTDGILDWKIMAPPEDCQPGGGINKICPQHLDPTAAAMYSGTPPYFAPVESNPTELALLEKSGYNGFIVEKQPDSADQYVVRIDHELNQHHHLFGRYTHWKIIFPAANPVAMPATYQAGPDTFTNQLVVADNYTISPTLNADIRLAYNRNWDNATGDMNYKVAQLGSNWAALAPQLTASEPPKVPAYMSWFGGPFGGDLDQIEGNDNYSVSLNITKVYGRHSFQFGGEARRVELYYINDTNPSGEFVFPAGGIAEFVTGQSLYIPGQSYLETEIASAAYDYYQGYYVTDVWKVSPKLTANLGVRWELPGAWLEKRDHNSVLLADHANPLGSFANPVPGGPTQLMGELVAVNSPDYNSRAQSEQHLHLFEPRVGLNYSIDPQTVIRAGFGISAPCIDCGSPSLEVSTSPFLSAVTQNQPGFSSISNPYPNGINLPLGRSLKVMEPYSSFPQTLIGGSITGQEPYQTYPYALQWNLNLERSFGSSIAATLSYSGSRGVHLGTYDVNLDQLPDQYDSIGGNCAASSGLLTGLCEQKTNPLQGIASPIGNVGAATANYGQFLLPYPEFSRFVSAGKYYGESSYNALLATLKKRLAAGSTVNINYTWAHLISDVNTGASFDENASFTGGITGPQDYTNPHADRANSGFDIRQILEAEYILDLPFGKGRRFLSGANGTVDHIVSGWSLSGITAFQSGLPLGLTVSGGNSLTEYFGAGKLRPNVVPGVPKKVGGSAYNRTLPGKSWFNPAAFTKPADWTFGNESQVDSSLRADGVDNWDINILKDTKIKEEISLQFRAELFNLFNHPQFVAPETDIDNGGFGTVAFQENNPRVAQLSLRLNF
jgi:hypothetical protein